MRKKIVVHSDRCTGCMLCAMACSLVKVGACNPVSSRIRIAEWRGKEFIVPVLCQNCEEPVCMPCCVVDAISRNEETGAVEINMSLCNNCKMCIKVCPYGGPAFDPVAKQVVMCDHCGGQPVCVEVCAREALAYVDVDEKGVKASLKGMADMRRSMVNLGEL